MQSFGEYVRELREGKNIGVRELARRIQVSASFISDIEQGYRFPSHPVMKRLAKELGTSIKDLEQFVMHKRKKDNDTAN